MTATVEDANQGYVAMQKKKLNAPDSSVFIRGIQTTIRILEKTPRDLGKVQLMIDQKEVALNQGKQYRADECIVRRITSAGMAQNVFEML